MARPPGADHARWGSLDDRFDRGQRKGTSPPRPKKQKPLKPPKPPKPPRPPKIPKARKSPGHRTALSRISSKLGAPMLSRPPALDDPFISRGMANTNFQLGSNNNLNIQHPQRAVHRNPRQARMSVESDQSGHGQPIRPSQNTTADLEANAPNNGGSRSSKWYFSVEVKWIIAVLTIASGTSGIAATSIQITYGYMHISSPGTGIWILFSFIGFVVFGFWCSEIRIHQARDRSFNIALPSPIQQRNERLLNERSQASIHELVELSPRVMAHHHTQIQLPAKTYKPESRSVNPAQASQDDPRDLLQPNEASERNSFDTSQAYNARHRSGVSRDHYPGSRQENASFEPSSSANIPRSITQSNFRGLYDEEDDEQEGAFPYDLPSRVPRLPTPLADKTNRVLQNYSISPSHSYNDLCSAAHPNNDLRFAAKNIAQSSNDALLSPSLPTQPRGRTPRLDPDMLAGLDAREQRLYFEQARGAFSTHGDSDDAHRLDVDNMLRPKSAVRDAEVQIDLDEMSPMIRSPRSGFGYFASLPVSAEVVAQENVANVDEAAEEDVQIVLKERRSTLERLSGQSTPSLIHGFPDEGDLIELERIREERRRELRNAEQSVSVPLVLGFQRQRESSAVSRGSPSMNTSHERVGRDPRRGDFVAPGTRSRSRNINVDSAAMHRDFELHGLSPPTPRLPNAPTEEPQDYENWI